MKPQCLISFLFSFSCSPSSLMHTSALDSDCMGHAAKSCPLTFLVGPSDGKMARGLCSRHMMIQVDFF